MAICLSYSCTCGLKTATLDEAQAHANKLDHDPTHTVSVHGRITADQNNKAVVNVVALEAATRKRLLDAELLRRARDKNLLPKRHVVGGSR